MFHQMNLSNVQIGQKLEVSSSIGKSPAKPICGLAMPKLVEPVRCEQSKNLCLHCQTTCLKEADSKGKWCNEVQRSRHCCTQCEMPRSQVSSFFVPISMGGDKIEKNRNINEFHTDSIV